MTKHNEENERLKREYLAYLKEAQRYSESSVDAVASAIARFEAYTKHRGFRQFHHQQAIAFKRHLAVRLNQRGTDKLSKSTVRSTLGMLRGFFHWLAGRPGFRSRFTYEDADYFNPTDRDSRIALAHRPRPVPSLEQVMNALNTMPTETVVQRRDRALFAFILLTGCRDRAAVSLKLKHIDFDKGLVFQDAREVETKRGKTITTYFFPIGERPLEIVRTWIAELRTDQLRGPDDAVFPSTAMALGVGGGLHVAGLLRDHWKNAGPVRRIFRAAFEAAGLHYFHPHSFRHLIARIGQERCRTPEEMKAWSQNLGHEQMLTTFTSYGRVEDHRQGEIVKALGRPTSNSTNLKELFEVVEQLKRR